MRDSHRIREQVEIRLEPRQIALLAITTMMFSGGLFAAGFLLGQKQAASAASMPTGVALAAIDAQSDAPAPAEPPHTPPAALGEVEFMFPSLLGSRPGRKRAPLPTLRLPAEVVAPSGASGKQTQPAPRPEPKRAERPAPRADGDAPSGLPMLRPAPRPQQAAVKAPAFSDEIEDRPPPVEKKKRVEKAPEPPPRRFTLQVKAVKSEADVNALVDTLKAAGFTPHVVKADIPGHGRYFRVRVGRFDSMREARAFQRRFKATSGLPDGGFIIDL